MPGARRLLISVTPTGTTDGTSPFWERAKKHPCPQRSEDSNADPSPSSDRFSSWCHNSVFFFLSCAGEQYSGLCSERVQALSLFCSGVIPRNTSRRRIWNPSQNDSHSGRNAAPRPPSQVAVETATPVWVLYRFSHEAERAPSPAASLENRSVIHVRGCFPVSSVSAVWSVQPWPFEAAGMYEVGRSEGRRADQHSEAPSRAGRPGGPRLVDFGPLASSVGSMLSEL